MTKNLTSKNCLIVFAPVFLEIGCDLVKSLHKKEPNIKITALCFGGYRVVDYILKNIDSDLIDKVYNLEEEEKKWIREKNIDFDYLQSFEDKFGSDYFGRVLTADRRIGNGYVLGGLARPNYLSKLAKKYPNRFPAIYVQGALSFFEILFSQIVYDFVFLYVVASSPTLLLSYFAKYHKVTLRCLYHSRIGNRNFLDSSPFGNLEILKNKYLNNDIVVSHRAQEKAKNYLKSFREKPVVPDYTSYFENKTDFILKDAIYFIVYFFAFYLRFFLPKYYRNILTKDKMMHKLFYLKRNILKLFFSIKFTNQIPNQKYVYFPLHVDPESSTMVSSPFHTNQIALIENLSKSIPADHLLVVKEHIPMIGFRPKNFYKTIMSFPRVKLINPRFDQFSLINKSSFVCTITGTAGLEALMLKKKVLLIGKNAPFSFFEKGIIVESDISILSKRFFELKKLSQIDDESILKYLGLIFQESFKMSTALLWQNYNNQPENEKSLFLEELSELMITLINEK